MFQVRTLIFARFLVIAVGIFVLCQFASALCWEQSYYYLNGRAKTVFPVNVNRYAILTDLPSNIAIIDSTGDIMRYWELPSGATRASIAPLSDTSIACVYISGITPRFAVYNISGAIILAHDILTTEYSNQSVPCLSRAFDGSYWLSGCFQDGATTEGLLIHLSAQGESLGSHIYGWSGTSEAFYRTWQLPSGGFLVTGLANRSNQVITNRMWLLRCDSSGDTIWSRKLDRFTGWGNGVAVSSVGPVVTGPMNGDSITPNRIVTVQFDWDGNEIWSRTINEDDGYGNHIVISPDGNIVVVGYVHLSTGFQMTGICYTTTGEQIWHRYYNSAGSMGYGGCLTANNDGLILCGFSSGAYLTKTNLWGLLNAPEHATIGLPQTTGLMDNYPNPFNPTTTIRYTIPKNSKVSLKIFDLAGHEVTTLVDTHQSPGEYNVVFDGRNLAAGTYFARMTAGDFVHTQKLILLK